MNHKIYSDEYITTMIARDALQEAMENAVDKAKMFCDAMDLVENNVEQKILMGDLQKLMSEHGSDMECI